MSLKECRRYQRGNPTYARLTSFFARSILGGSPLTTGCATLSANVHNTLVLVTVCGRGYAIPRQQLALLSTACRIDCYQSIADTIV
jgi:hypothetical protein